MKKPIIKRTITKISSGILTACFIGSLLLSLIHNHELAGITETGDCHTDHCNCSETHNSSAHNHITYANSEAEHHEHHTDTCPLCIFNKYLSGIKYYTSNPSGSFIFVFGTEPVFCLKILTSRKFLHQYSPRAPPA